MFAYRRLQKRATRFQSRFYTFLKRIISVRIAVLAAIIALLLYFTLGDYGFIKIGKLYFGKKRLKAELQAAKAANDSLINLRNLLQKDETLIEKYAREKLGMAKKNETVYIFLKQPAKPDSSN